MKKKLIFLFVIILIINSSKVFAKEEIKDIYDFIPEKTLDIIEESKINLDIENLNIDFSDVTKTILDIMQEVLKKDLKLFSLNVVLCILFAVFSFVGHNENTENILSLVIACCILLSTTPIIFDSIKNCLESFDNMAIFVRNSVPIYTSLMISAGDLGKTAVVSGGLLIITDFFVGVFSSFLAPMVSVFVALSVSEVVFKNNIISEVSSFIMKSIMFLFGGITTLYMGIFSIKNVISLSSDTLAKKAVRFSLSGFIPIGGSMVSESIDTYFSSAEFLKSSAGIVAVVSVTMTLLAPCLALISKILILRLSKTVSDILGSKGIASFLKVICDGLYAMLSMLLCVGFMTVFTLAVMIKGV